MSLLDTIKSIFSSRSSADPNVLWLYVRCSRCGTLLAVRVDTRNELGADYEQGGYVLFKEMMDSKCFALMRAEVHFDQSRNVKEQKVEGGKLMTLEEYEAAQNPNPKTVATNTNAGTPNFKV